MNIEKFLSNLIGEQRYKKRPLNNKDLKHVEQKINEAQ